MKYAWMFLLGLLVVIPLSGVIPPPPMAVPMGSYAAPTISVIGHPNSGLYFVPAGPNNPVGAFCFVDLNGQVAGCMDDEGYRYGATGAARWSSASIQGNFAWDNGGLTTANTHDGTLSLCTGSCADNNHNGNLIGTNLTAYGNMRQIPVMFSMLPACSPAIEGASRAVIDSQSDIGGMIMSGGGSYHEPAYCNGTNWVVR